MDGSAARYALIVADLIDSVQWKGVGDFRSFTEVLYPFQEVRFCYPQKCKLVVISLALVSSPLNVNINLKSSGF